MNNRYVMDKDGHLSLNPNYEMLEKVELDNYYRNKKNKHLYLVMEIVRHSETLEDMVLYAKAKPESKDEDVLWVRPLELFKEKFEDA